MPEYKHRVTVTKSTSNNQVSIDLENMGDCIVDVRWNDCEDTNDTKVLVDSESCSHAKTEDESSKKIIIQKIIQALSIPFGIFCIYLLIALFTFDKLNELSFSSIIGISVLTVIVGPLFVLNAFNKIPNNLLIRLIFSYIVFVIAVPFTLSTYISKYCSLNEYVSFILCFSFSSIIWTIIHMIFHHKKYYPYIQIVSQITLGLITVIGVFINDIEEKASFNVKTLYVLSLIIYLILPLLIQYKIIND